MRLRQLQDRQDEDDHRVMPSVESKQCNHWWNFERQYPLFDRNIHHRTPSWIPSKLSQLHMVQLKLFSSKHQLCLVSCLMKIVFNKKLSIYKKYFWNEKSKGRGSIWRLTYILLTLNNTRRQNLLERHFYHVTLRNRSQIVCQHRVIIPYNDSRVNELPIIHCIGSESQPVLLQQMFWRSIHWPITSDLKVNRSKTVNDSTF